MRYIYTSGKLIAFVVIILFTVTGIFAQEPLTEEPNAQAPSGLSGKVVDTKGKPIPEFTFIIRSMQNLKGPAPPIGMLPFAFEELLEDQNREGKPRAVSRAKTDAEGAFSVTNIQPGTVQIYAVPKAMLDVMEKGVPNLPPEVQQNLPPEVQQNLRPQLQRIPMGLMHPGNRESEMQILSIRLNKVTFFYIEGPGPFTEFAFGLKPGVNIEDITITVKKRLKFRARIVYADGTPLAHAEADLNMRFRGGEFGGGSGSHGTDCFTDADGYFTQYRDEPGFYTLSIRHKTFSGGAGPFLLKENVEPKDIVIKLDGNLIPKQPHGEVKELDDVKAGRFIKDLLNKDNVRQPIMRPAATPKKITWIINPANGHAYAKIQCQNWHDAQQKAIAEGAHLVSINDEEEQFWLEIIFGRAFWIGLNDVEEEGVWVWDSGEPVTYTNWTTREFPHDPNPETERDYVAIALHDHENRWQSAGPNSPLWRMTRQAIIEKDGLVSKIPEAPESEDE